MLSVSRPPLQRRGTKGENLIPKGRNASARRACYFCRGTSSMVSRWSSDHLADTSGHTTLVQREPVVRSVAALEFYTGLTGVTHIESLYSSSVTVFRSTSQSHLPAELQPSAMCDKGYPEHLQTTRFLFRSWQYSGSGA